MNDLTIERFCQKYCVSSLQPKISILKFVDWFEALANIDNKYLEFRMELKNASENEECDAFKDRFGIDFRFDDDCDGIVPKSGLTDTEIEKCFEWFRKTCHPGFVRPGKNETLIISVIDNF